MTLPALSPRALRTRWSLLRLARHGVEPAEWVARADGVVHGRGMTASVVEVMGLRFGSPLLLAAGFDRHGVLLENASRLGLGAVETGSLRTSSACPSPRVRVAAARRHVAAGGGRMGVCLHGLSLLVPRLEGRGDTRRGGYVLERLQALFAACHATADYVVLNPGRSGATPAQCVELLAALAEVRDRLARPLRLALVAKLPAPWLAAAGGVRWAHHMIDAGADGLLLSAEGDSVPAALRIARVAAEVGERTALISVGGIGSVREAAARLAAGADLVQVHRALIAAPRRALSLSLGIAGLGVRRGRRQGACTGSCAQG